MRFWGAEQDAVIIEHYNKMRAKQIAELLCVTKNAVIGRAKRLGLSRTMDARVKSHKPLAPFGSWRRKGWDRIQRMFDLKEAAPAPVIPEEPVIGGISFMDLAIKSCRFPIGGAGIETMFCGADIHGEKPYCLGHCQVAYWGFRG